MNKAKYIINIIIGSVILAQLCPNVSRISGSISRFGLNIASGMMTGFWICMVIVIIMFSVFILQNLLGLVMEFVYGEGSSEGDKLAGILDKVSGVSRCLYQAVGAAIFGVLGAIGLFYPDLTGRDTAVGVVSGVFILFALIVCIRSVRSIVSIIRER